MKTYTINRARLACTPAQDAGDFWSQADVANLDFFPWYQAGAKWSAEARVLYDNERLYWRIATSGDHDIVAQRTRPNEPVSLDSCAEFFLQPGQQPGVGYFNFEINCVGAMLLAHGTGRHGRVFLPSHVAQQVRIRHSMPGPTKQRAPGDDSWHIEATVPLRALADYAKVPLPSSGAEWQGNFYRCADDSSNPQWSCWNLIEIETPDFHRPEFFGRLLFG